MSYVLPFYPKYFTQRCMFFVTMIIRSNVDVAKDLDASLKQWFKILAGGVI